VQDLTAGLHPQWHVFSYWFDNNDNFNVKTAEYEDIADIKVIWSDRFTENTVVEVYRKDQTKIALYLSANDGKDEIFVSGLRMRWGQKYCRLDGKVVRRNHDTWATWRTDCLRADPTST
jgi:hypothetical protein